jgi:WD40 repeat protein
MQLLNKHLPKPGEPDLRGFEWRYLRQLCRGDANAALPTQDGPIQALACSPDGHWLAVGLRDRLSIWDLRTRSHVRDLSDGAMSLTFLPDGTTLIAGSVSAVRLWRTTDWTELAPLINSSGPVALSSDGARLATSDSDHRPRGPGGGPGGPGGPFPGHGRAGIRIWDTSNWEELRFLSAASSPMAFSPDGQTLAAGAREKGIALWSLTGTSPELLLRDSTNLFFRPMFGGDHLLAFSPDGKWIVAPRNTLSERGVFVVSIWDAHTGQEEPSMPADPEHVEHTGFISSLAFLPDGNTLVTASWDHSIRLWDFTKRQVRTTLHGHLNELRSIAFFADGKTLISGSKDGGIKFWKAEQTAKEDFLPGPWEPQAFSADSSILAVFSRPNPMAREPARLAFLNLLTRELEPAQLVLEHPRDRFGPRPSPPQNFGRPEAPPKGREPSGGPPRGFGMGGEMCVALSGDLNFVAQGLNNGAVLFWNRKTGETNTMKVGESRVEVIALSPDSSVLVTGTHSPAGEAPALHWWNLRNGTDGALAAEASRLWFSPDGRLLATQQRESGLQLWDMETHTLRARLSGEAPFFSFAFSADAKIVATTGGPEDPDNAVRLWETSSGKLLGVCTGHKQAVWSIAFSPDGATLATASDDSTLRFWNVATQQELLSIRRLGGGLQGLRFSPDGQWLAGGSGLFAQTGGIQFFRAPLLGKREEDRTTSF